jgi:hypothetical protein
MSSHKISRSVLSRERHL